MTKKNLHIIVKYFYPVAAGIETNIMETYSSLSKDEWNIVLHTSKNTLTETNSLSPHETIRGIEVRRYTWNWYGFTPQIDENADLVCLHNFNIFPHLFVMLQTLFKKIVGQKKYVVILTPHGGFTPEWSTFPFLQRIVKRMYHNTLGAFLVNVSCDGVRAVSLWEQKEMVICGIRSQLIELINNGIENLAFENPDQNVSSEFKSQITKFGRYILQIGRIHTIKNFETTIKALALCDSDLKFIIAGPVGEPEYLEYLKRLLTELHLEGRVIFFGVVRNSEKYYLMKHAQMMVHMAIWESYCNVVHEGMSQGLVCIVGNNTALPLLIKNGVNGFCLPAKDEKAVADKIMYVLQHKDSKEIQAMEEVNRFSVREHSWVSVAKKMALYYKCILETK